MLKTRRDRAPKTQRESRWPTSTSHGETTGALLCSTFMRHLRPGLSHSPICLSHCRQWPSVPPLEPSSKAYISGSSLSLPKRVDRSSRPSTDCPEAVDAGLGPLPSLSAASAASSAKWVWPVACWSGSTTSSLQGGGGGGCLWSPPVFMASVLKHWLDVPEGGAGRRCSLSAPRRRGG